MGKPPNKGDYEQMGNKKVYSCILCGKQKLEAIVENGCNLSF